jgi:hypothetical protein
MYFLSLLHEELRKSVDFRRNSIYWHLTFENFNGKTAIYTFMTWICTYNVATFKFKLHLCGVVILRPTFLVQDKMFRKFLKKIVKTPIFKDNSLKVRALVFGVLIKLQLFYCILCTFGRYVVILENDLTDIEWLLKNLEECTVDPLIRFQLTCSNLHKLRGHRIWQECFKSSFVCNTKPQRDCWLTN